MKVLISGICGFVGNSLARWFTEHDSTISIVGFDNFIRPGSELNRRALQSLGVKFIHADLRVQSDIDALPDADWVIDAAANPSVLAGVDGPTTSRQLIEHNLLGTVNLLEYCKARRAGFVLLSTSRVYSIPALKALPFRVNGDAFTLDGTQPLPPGVSGSGVDETFSTEPPVSLYGIAKRASEQLALEYGDACGFPVWINRCGVLAGAGQFGRADQGIFGYWIHAWTQRRPLRYIGFGGAGRQVRDCLHPHDLAKLVLAQMRDPARKVSRTINVGGGMVSAISLAQLSAWCMRRFGKHSVGSDTDSRTFDVAWLVLSAERANQTWKWEPTVPLAAILEEIARHAEQNVGWLDSSD